MEAVNRMKEMKAVNKRAAGRQQAEGSCGLFRCVVIVDGGTHTSQLCAEDVHNWALMSYNCVVFCLVVDALCGCAWMLMEFEIHQLLQRSTDQRRLSKSVRPHFLVRKVFFSERTRVVFDCSGPPETLAGAEAVENTEMKF
ncbi:hypothetical protein Q1695_013006 [Nippostrongylus brasiliensis]|nr:hypothetical protein Q1695_013006 [Nippostrongylus brasiliensis]